MKKFLTFLTTGLVSVLFCASLAVAEEVKTDYFTLSLPSDWVMPQPPQNVNGGIIAVMQNKAKTSAVSIAVTPVTLPAKDLATQTFANMKTGGFTVSEPVASGDSYVGEFSHGKAKGVSYFSSNGKAGSVITILGTTTGPGKDLLTKNFKPVDPRLFPSSF